MEQTCSVEMIHSGESTHITCPSTAKYEDFIQIAMERFSIPIKYKHFIRLYAGHRYFIAQNAFDKYLMHHPDSKMVFELRVAYLEVLDKLHGQTSTNSENRSQKRARNERVTTPRRKLFEEYLEDSDVHQPNVKRMRTDFSKVSELIDELATPLY